MAYRLNGEDLLDFTKTQQTSGPTQQSYHSAPIPQTNSGITFQVEQLPNDIAIVHSKYSIGDDLIIAGKGDNDLLEIQINLSVADIFYKDKRRKNQITKASSGNISFYTAEDNYAEISMQEDSLYETFDIHLPLHFLDQFQGESAHMDHLLSSIQQRVPTRIHKNGIKLTAPIHHIIRDIRECNFQGLARTMYLSGKVYELCAHLYQNNVEPAILPSIHPSDIDRIQETADLIQKNIDAPLTISALASHAGISPSKLTRDFKRFFGKTIFEYMQAQRMEKAKSYLLESALSIQEISYLLGYNNSSNFSIAFKEFFGFAPSTLRSCNYK